MHKRYRTGTTRTRDLCCESYVLREGYSMPYETGDSDVIIVCTGGKGLIAYGNEYSECGQELTEVNIDDVVTMPRNEKLTFANIHGRWSFCIVSPDN